MPVGCPDCSLLCWTTAEAAPAGTMMVVTGAPSDVIAMIQPSLPWAGLAAWLGRLTWDSWGRCAGSSQMPPEGGKALEGGVLSAGATLRISVGKG